MRNAKYIVTTLVISVLIVSCATTGQTEAVRKNSLRTINETGSLADDHGILLLSAGRKRKATKEDGTNFAGILPFLSYHILRKTSDLAYEELAFIPAEAGFSNQLGRDYYGFIHYRELPVGEYVAIGNATRGRNIYMPGGMIWTPENRTTEIAFAFSVDAGKINYIGELMTMKGFLQNEDIRVLDLHERDVAFLHEEHSKTIGIPVHVQLAKPTDIDEMPLPEALN